MNDEYVVDPENKIEPMVESIIAPRPQPISDEKGVS
mgnify:CR=1 FL=1